MNVFDMRNEMMAAYLREVEALDFESTYVLENESGEIQVFTHDADGSRSSVRCEMSNVIAWIWSKVK